MAGTLSRAANQHALHEAQMWWCIQAGASREKERNSFFDSLRRKSRSPSLPPLGEAENAAAAGSETPAAAEANQPVSRAITPQGASDTQAVAPCTAEKQQNTPSSAAAAASKFDLGYTTPVKPAAAVSATPKKSSSGSLSERLLIPAEEEAFLRSLGWEGDELDDDGEEGVHGTFPNLQWRWSQLPVRPQHAER